jgi:hypothetical protein
LKIMQATAIRWLTLGFGMLLAVAATAGQGRYMNDAQFLEQAFSRMAPAPGTLWVSPELRVTVEETLGQRFPLLRVRYWQADDTTAWILDQVGKEQPITIGISVRGGRIDLVRVLEFRESRGWEVRYPFFTDQFHGAALVADGEIDKGIDGITGATLSVAAVGRAVKLALLLDGQLTETREAVASLQKVH